MMDALCAVCAHCMCVDIGHELLQFKDLLFLLEQCHSTAVQQRPRSGAETAQGLHFYHKG